MNNRNNNRRKFLRAAGLSFLMPSIWLAPGPAPVAVHRNNGIQWSPSDVKGLKITAIDVHVVEVNQRGDWHIVELRTNKGIAGIGECSHAFPKSDPAGRQALAGAIAEFFQLINNESPFSIEQFRQRGFAIADNKLKKTVFSGIEQALWDLCGKTLGVPVYDLLGGKVREKLRVYANINRATNERDGQGRRPVASFQKNAEQALKNGFTAVKLAPFDEMKPLSTATAQQSAHDIDHAVSCIEGVRAVIGNAVDLLIDVHSHLNVELATQTAARIIPSALYWFEEPMDPQKFPTETKIIRESIKQPLAGGEAIFGRSGYAELIRQQALEIIMPDVKHCGGIQECRFIAAMAETAGGIKVAPHNPSGPVATAASVAACAGMPNFSILEYAFGEVPWSNDLVAPRELFKDGYLPVSDLPGLGVTLNRAILNKHRL